MTSPHPDASVVITGSAGAIGSATVAWFLEAGFSVLGLDRADAETTDGRHVHRVVELADADAVERAVADGVSGLPQVSHLVTVAGGALPGEPDSQDEPWSVSPELFRASVDANLVTQFLSVRAVVPHLLQGDERDRSIVLTSSYNGFTAQGMPAYSAAKSGLVGLVQGFAGPLGAKGVRINVVAPGTVVTPRTERLWSGVPGHFERLEGTTVTGRLATPDDVADSIGALAVAMRHVTGQVVLVDGGQSLAARPVPPTAGS
jgi:meso-butanediol dehydrogenase / (S,S)-butanediol dehydrogenase / diacetyl reductase